jgi:hypothetical protein
LTAWGLSPHKIRSLVGCSPNLQPTGITFDTSTAVVGGTVFFDSGVSNTGDVDTSVFNIKWFVNGQEVGAYGSHSSVPANIDLWID